MNVEKAKNATLAFLLILNIVLFMFLSIRESAFRLSSAQEKAITSLLAQNKISLYSQLLTDFSPMRQLSFVKYDFSGLQNVLFESGEPDRTVEEFYRTVKTRGNAWIIINKDIATGQNQNRLDYFNPDGYGALTGEETDGVTLEQAKRLCGALLEQIEEKNAGFILESSGTDADGAMMLVYRGVYRDNVIYTNYAGFNVTKNGITQISFSFMVPTGFTGQPREIYSADEALLGLVSVLREAYGEEPLIITGMDMVYNLESASGDDLAAIPCYRFFLKSETDPDITRQFLISAYTNASVAY